jgi:chorismate mutase-like protein
MWDRTCVFPMPDTPMNTLNDLRNTLDGLDAQLIDVLGQRFAICERVAAYKKAHRIPMMQHGRIEKVKQQAAARGSSMGITSDFVSRLYDLIIGEACRLELNLMNGPALESADAPPSAVKGKVAVPRQAGNGLREFSQLSPSVVIGARGSVGQLIASRLRQQGVRITGLDCAASRSRSMEPSSACIRANITAPTPEAIASIGKARVVFVCLPESTALAAWHVITKYMSPGALWVDTLSVKSRICAALAKLKNLEVISLNPLFAPGIGFEGQNVAAVEVVAGPKSAMLMSLLRQWNSTVITMPAAEHDLMSAAVQLATHSAILSFGFALRELGVEFARAWKFSTPPFRMLVSLLSRIILANPEIYWEIQESNTYGSHVRDLLQNGLAEIEAAVQHKDFEGFRAFFQTTKEALDGNAGELADLCSGLLAHAGSNLQKNARNP